MNKVFAQLLAVLLFFSIPASSNGQQRSRRNFEKKPSLLPNVEYDARLFLSETQRITFNRIYPEFDEPRVEKKWEWKDVDPLGLFSPEENRRSRRELFLFEYSPYTMNQNDGKPSTEQLAFRTVLLSEYEESEILMSAKTIKLIHPYTSLYEEGLPTRRLLEKVAQTGLQWAQLGGANYYVYNGSILMGRYKSGFVGLVDLNIDRPAIRNRRR